MRLRLRRTQTTPLYTCTSSSRICVAGARNLSNTHSQAHRRRWRNNIMASTQPSANDWVPQDKLKAPPPVIVTPCDPWPRPYYLEDGLRRVAPYHFTYNTNCKGRWIGMELLEIFKTEFRDRPLEYYKGAIETGQVVVNGKETTGDTVVNNGDMISHTTHRHEPPVSADAIGIVHEDDDLIVISKPAGIPVHPAGRYNYNCIVEIMRAERGYTFNPRPCNRLDRLTSGVMFLGKHAKAAEKISKQILDRTVKKEYVARVIGEFPDGDVVCDQPVMQVSPRLGLNRARASGKHALTVFKRLAYYPPKEGLTEDSTRADEDARKEAEAAGKPWRAKRGYSIVRCLPLTGRTHQLRVHLQFLGHPIANDPIYCNQRVFGPLLAAGDDSADHDADIVSKLENMGKTETAEAMAYHDEMVDEYNKKKAEKMTGEVCDICDTPLYSDPGAHELGIYLHAKRYSAEDGSWWYETGLPQWALPPEGMSGPTETTPDTAPDELAAKVESVGLDDGKLPHGVSVNGDKIHISPKDSLWTMPGG